MSQKSQNNKKRPTKYTPLQWVIMGLYIVAVALSMVVVVSFIALKLFAPPPKVPSQMEFPLPTDTPSVQSPGWTKDPSATDPPPETLILNRREGVYTCLMLGVADRGGSDTIMLGVFDTKNKSASLISIPRDTVVNYNGVNVKINAVYSYSGVNAVSRCVREMLAVPIDFYMTVDFQAFKEIVDEIEGVEFNIPEDLDYDDPTQNLHIHLKKGLQTLNGENALKLVRFREGYVSQDIRRAEIQRAFLVALVKQAFTLYNLDKIPDLIGILNTYVKSDMELSEMVYFGTQAFGMNLDTALTSSVLSTNWNSPYIVPGEEEVLKLVNSLGIYEEEVPAEILRLVYPG